MINLQGDGVSITVDKSNPIYKNLSRFVGEVFVVESSDEEEKPKQEDDPVSKYYLQEETEAVDVQIAEYFKRLKTLFPDEKSMARTILTHHADRFFGASEKTTVARYLATLETINNNTILLVRVIDNKPVYLSVPRELVTRV